MLDYGDFYDIAEYGNENWKGNFSKKEIAINAYNYFCDFKYSKLHPYVESTIQELLTLLDEDNSEECVDWACQIRKELGLCQIESERGEI